MVLARSILYFCALVVTIFLFTALLLLIAPTPFRIRHKVSTAWSRCNLWLLKNICGLDYRISGVENIPDETCIFMVKHQSAWETIALFTILPHRIVWVLKRELMWLPVFGWALALNQPIAINRSAGRAAVKQLIEKGINRLSNGNSIIIFPEGTRVAPGTRKRYGIGGALLALESRHPIVPVCHNAGVFWRRRDIRKYPGTIDIVIGEAYQPDGHSAQEISNHVEEWIETTLEKLQQTH